MKFFATALCQSQVHCVACRTSSSWRQSVVTVGLIDHADFVCPHGLTAESAVVVQANARAKIKPFVPPFQEEGRAAWAWLHRKALNDGLTMELLASEFEAMIPRSNCSCVAKWRSVLTSAPPLPSTNQFAWTVGRHNDVNVALHKPLFSVAAALQLYRKAA